MTIGERLAYVAGFVNGVAAASSLNDGGLPQGVPTVSASSSSNRPGRTRARKLHNECAAGATFAPSIACEPHPARALGDGPMDWQFENGRVWNQSRLCPTGVSCPTGACKVVPGLCV